MAPIEATMSGADQAAAALRLLSRPRGGPGRGGPDHPSRRAGRGRRPVGFRSRARRIAGRCAVAGILRWRQKQELALPGRPVVRAFRRFMGRRFRHGDRIINRRRAVPAVLPARHEALGGRGTGDVFEADGGDREGPRELEIALEVWEPHDLGGERQLAQLAARHERHAVADGIGAVGVALRDLLDLAAPEAVGRPLGGVAVRRGGAPFFRVQGAGSRPMPADDREAPRSSPDRNHRELGSSGR